MIGTLREVDLLMMSRIWWAVVGALFIIGGVWLIWDVNPWLWVGGSVLVAAGVSHLVNAVLPPHTTRWGDE